MHSRKSHNDLFNTFTLHSLKQVSLLHFTRPSSSSDVSQAIVVFEVSYQVILLFSETVSVLPVSHVIEKDIVPGMSVYNAAEETIIRNVTSEACFPPLKNNFVKQTL